MNFFFLEVNELIWWHLEQFLQWKTYPENFLSIDFLFWQLWTLLTVKTLNATFPII